MKELPEMEPILRPGHNCWIAGVHASRAGLLVDGEAYYRAFHAAASRARKHLLIAGWRFDSEVRILRGPDGDLTLLDFLKQICQKRRELRVYILAWNFSANYAWEWEKDQQEKFEAAAPGQIIFRYDNTSAAAGSHHQKLVIMDGHEAFVGGMDFSAGTWDDREHRAKEPIRADCGQEPHGPYHDVQAYLAGPAAAELTKYFAVRWRRATAEELTLEDAPGQRSPIDFSLKLPAGPVGFSVLHAATTQEPTPIKQCRNLLIDAVHAAEQAIYLENQYFSSEEVAKAFIERMKARQRPPLDIVIVLPRDFHGPTEAAALGPPQYTALEALARTAAETEHCLGVYYGVAKDPLGAELPVYIHSKVMVVDDRFLTVGSTNTSNRSMGLDSELNVSWETFGDKTLTKSIRTVRVDLLAEHCGVSPTSALARSLRDPKGLVTRLDGIAAAGHTRLRGFPADKMAKEHAWLKGLERLGIYFDPARSLVEEF